MEGGVAKSKEPSSNLKRLGVDPKNIIGKRASKAPKTMYKPEAPAPKQKDDPHREKRGKLRPLYAQTVASFGPSFKLSSAERRKIMNAVIEKMGNDDREEMRGSPRGEIVALIKMEIERFVEEKNAKARAKLSKKAPQDDDFGLGALISGLTLGRNRKVAQRKAEIESKTAAKERSLKLAQQAAERNERRKRREELRENLRQKGYTEMEVDEMIKGMDDHDIIRMLADTRLGGASKKRVMTSSRK